MKFLAKNLKYLRKQRGLTQKQLTQQLGMTQSNYSYYENGFRDAPYSILTKFARFYQISAEKITQNDISKEKSPEVLIIESYGRKVEFLTAAPQAGILTRSGFMDQRPKKKSIIIPDDYHQKTGNIAVRVQGDSMMPTINESDLVICRKLQDETVRNGHSDSRSLHLQQYVNKILVFVTEDDDFMIKRLKSVDTHRNEAIFVSDNPRFPKEIRLGLQNNEVREIWKAEKIQREL